MPTVSSCPSDSAHDLGQIAFSVGPALSYNEPSPQTVSSYLFVKYFDISDPKHGKKKKEKKRKEKKKYCCRYSAFKIPNKMCCRFLS